MLALATRRMTADERSELEARRSGLIAKYIEGEESLQRSAAGAAWSIMWVFGFFALIAVFNLHAGDIGAALVAGVVASFLGVAVWKKLEPAPPHVLDRPPIMRIDRALAADEVRVIDIHADAAVSVRGVDDHDDPRIVGDLLRAGADQVIYVSRELCSGVDPGRLPNSELRIIFSENLELVRVEATGERCEPLAIVEDDTDPSDPLWRSELEMMVWTPSEDRFALLGLDTGELTPYSVELEFDFRRLTAALVSRIYR